MVYNKEKQKEYMRRWFLRHPEYRLKKWREWHDKLKIEVFSHYSPELKCQTCGFSDIRALQMDHINGGGTKHSKKINHHIIRFLKKNNYPYGFQVLCANCNWIKVHEKQENIGKFKKSE